MVGKVHLTRPIEIKELNERYRTEKDPRVKERLLALIHLYEGKTVIEASRIIKRSVRTVERWISSWNENGYEGLEPSFTGGPKPKLTDSEWDEIVKEIENKGSKLRLQGRLGSLKEEEARAIR
ncbi:MAG: helix-turn-helix domain-containing protein [Nitrososphaerota archaeon]|jgi:transposase|nr:helix-turn-helix domain-containing protein [Nitrososphaerota archaeon]MDG6930862.1 helix-turn-helix domain-containing protein [Nitrososphaerota archaeon]